MECPIKPDESDCCNSGCNPCILDAYEEELKKFQACLLNKEKKIQSQCSNCLSPTAYSEFCLIAIIPHTTNSKLFTFQYVGSQRIQNPLQINDCKFVIYEPGQHLMLKDSMFGNAFQRAYTPLYVKGQPSNQFTVLVKCNKQGRMSKVFHRMFLGYKGLWRGPYGNYKVNYDEKNLLFISQGTGIAPFYTIICDMLNNEDCNTFLKLFSCCHPLDLFLREELYKMTANWNFTYELFVSKGDIVTVSKKYNEIVNYTRLGTENIQKYLENVKGDFKVLVCGKKNFSKSTVMSLHACAVPNDAIIVFT
ncbi:hypothetical protein ABEB36_006797 [Hypothenemus hampei]|uniref:NADH-cytochrome b5 reductase n=1 Tax=Hypothenemus hampei TaxID=57062 RepID=A0ABD1ERS5_HYPHA